MSAEVKNLAQILEASFPSHHAHLILGRPEESLNILKLFLTERYGKDFFSPANPDFLFWESGAWGIDDSRALKFFATRKPVRFRDKVMVISAATLSTEAQNALLKILEEPPENTYFVLLQLDAGLLLPTILSRCNHLFLSEKDLPTEGSLADQFVTSDISIRGNLVKEVLHLEEEKPGSGLNFLNQLLAIYWKKIGGHPQPQLLRGAEAISLAVKLSAARGSSLRLLLDHLAAVVPRL